MRPDEAIEAAELVEAETRYLHQLAREAYAAGHADGYRAGYRQADADQAARWNQAAGAVVDGPDRAEIEERRWGPGGRAHFADPRPGDFPGFLKVQFAAVDRELAELSVVSAFPRRGWTGVSTAGSWSGSGGAARDDRVVWHVGPGDFEEFLRGRAGRPSGR